jgi:hypothetical protein
VGPFRAFVAPPSRKVVVRTSLSPASTEDHLRESITPARWWNAPPAGSIAGSVRDGRLKVWVAAGRNSWRPVLDARIEADPDGGSIVSGSIASSRTVDAFSILWLFGALLLSGFLVLAALVGLVTGEPTVRDGGGRALSPPVALAVAVGVLLLFGAVGTGLPTLSRRMAAGDPDRLIAFVVSAIEGTVIAG